MTVNTDVWRSHVNASVTSDIMPMDPVMVMAPMSGDPIQSRTIVPIGRAVRVVAAVADFNRDVLRFAAWCHQKRARGNERNDQDFRVSSHKNDAHCMSGNVIQVSDRPRWTDGSGR